MFFWHVLSQMPKGKKRKAEKQPDEEKPAKKIKLDIFSSLENEENMLPDELVLKIFRQLDREAVLPAASVCRQWFRIGQEDIFAWIEFDTFYLEENPLVYGALRRGEAVRNRYGYGYGYGDVDEDELKEELKLWREDPVHLGQAVKMKRLPRTVIVVCNNYDNTLYSNNYQHSLWKDLLDSDGEMVAVVSEEEKLPAVAFSAPTNLWKAELIEVTMEEMKLANKGPVWRRDRRVDVGQRAWKLIVYLNIKT